MGELSLEVDDATVVRGEPITGTVNGAHGPATVRVQLFTTGLSEVGQHGGPQHPVESDGTFTLPAPRWPLTFAGKNVRLSWLVRAEDASGQTARQRVAVVAPDEARFDLTFAGGEASTELPRLPLEVPANANPAAGALVGLTALGLGGLGVWGIVHYLQPRNYSDAIWGCFILLLAAYVLGNWALRLTRGADPEERARIEKRNRATQAIGDGSLTLTSPQSTAFRGGDEGWRLELAVGQQAPELDLEAKILVVERTKERYTLADENVLRTRDRDVPVVRVPIAFSPGGVGRFVGRFELPSPNEVPGDFQEDEVTIYWRLELALRSPTASYDRDATVSLAATIAGDDLASHGAVY